MCVPSSVFMFVHVVSASVTQETCVSVWITSVLLFFITQQLSQSEKCLKTLKCECHIWTCYFFIFIKNVCLYIYFFLKWHQIHSSSKNTWDKSTLWSQMEMNMQTERGVAGSLRRGHTSLLPSLNHSVLQPAIPDMIQLIISWTNTETVRIRHSSPRGFALQKGLLRKISCWHFISLSLFFQSLHQ